MSRIVAGRFDRSIDADATLADLQKEGFRSGEFESFYVSPPGQHDKTPIGGDSHSDAGARKAGFGGAAGAIIGAAVGAAAGAVVSQEFGVVAIFLGGGLGAYLGSFAGSMAKMRNARTQPSSVEHPSEPRGGRMIAVNVDRPEMEPRALDVLQRHGARNVGRTEGTWRDGSWRDFDPRTPLGA